MMRRYDDTNPTIDKIAAADMILFANTSLLVGECQHN